MGGFGRAALIGAFVAVVLAAGLAVAGYLGLLEGLLPAQKVDRLLVIATAPDKSGVEVATVAFVLEADGSRATVLDTFEPVTVAGTSAKNAREALPYGGGDAVAEALAGQTAGEALPWVVLSAASWEKLVNDAGGVTATVPADVNVYTDGRLTLVDAGTRRLTGAEAVALASGVDYLDQGSTRAAVTDSLSAGLSKAVSDDPGALVVALETAGTSTSLSSEEIAVVSGAKP